MSAAPSRSPHARAPTANTPMTRAANTNRSLNPPHGRNVDSEKRTTNTDKTKRHHNRALLRNFSTRAPLDAAQRSRAPRTLEAAAAKVQGEKAAGVKRSKQSLDEDANEPGLRKRKGKRKRRGSQEPGRRTARRKQKPSRQRSDEHQHLWQDRRGRRIRQASRSVGSCTMHCMPISAWQPRRTAAAQWQWYEGVPSSLPPSST